MRASSSTRSDPVTKRSRHSLSSATQKVARSASLTPGGQGTPSEGEEGNIPEERSTELVIEEVAHPLVGGSTTFSSRPAKLPRTQGTEL